MSESTEVHELLDAIAKVLWRCVVFGVVLLALWFGCYLLCRNWIYGIQKKWFFHLTPHEFQLINYCGMGLVKVCVLLFFLAPYIAIRLVLKKPRRSLPPVSAKGDLPEKLPGAPGP